MVVADAELEPVVEDPDEDAEPVPDGAAVVGSVLLVVAVVPVVVVPVLADEVEPIPGQVAAYATPPPLTMTASDTAETAMLLVSLIERPPLG